MSHNLKIPETPPSPSRVDDGIAQNPAQAPFPQKDFGDDLCTLHTRASETLIPGRSISSNAAIQGPVPFSDQ
jgi:hypothetical protein